MAPTFIVAIDGPAGAGKSTVSKQLARNLGFTLVDTGAIYRCVALAAARSAIRFDDDVRLGELLGSVEVTFEFVDGENRVRLSGEDVSLLIRTPEISAAASQVSARPVVRAGLLELQRRLARLSTVGAVLEGRDIGTVVFPEAQAKFFLTATSRQRAERRHKELAARGQEVPFEQVLADQERRDRQDQERELAPLRAAADAVIVDSTTLGQAQVVTKMEQVVRERLARR